MMLTLTVWTMRAIGVMVSEELWTSTTAMVLHTHVHGPRMARWSN